MGIASYVGNKISWSNRTLISYEHQPNGRFFFVEDKNHIPKTEVMRTNARVNAVVFGSVRVFSVRQDDAFQTF
jgi:hypothetical protein